MNDTDELAAQIKQLLTSQKFAVLSTGHGGQPYASLVAFAFSEDLKALYFATTRATRKYANLSGDARVALLIDSRTNSPADLYRAAAVTATGKAEEVTGGERGPIQTLYLKKHPELEQFLSSPTCGLFTVAVDIYFLVNRFQNVRELHIIR